MCSGLVRWVIAVPGICVWFLTMAGAEELPVTSGLELRFDATVFSNRRPGAYVTEWRDTSGNHRHAVSGGAGPLYGEVRTPVGLYAVSFHDICDEAMSFCYNPNGRDITVLAVTRSRLDATEWPYYFKGFIGWVEVAGETPLALGSFNITQTVISLSGYGEAGMSYTIGLTHAPATGFTLNTVRLDSAAGVLDVFRNKRLLGSLPRIREPIQGAASCGHIGGIGACEGLGWAGDVAEILVYSRALTEPEREAVETYLHEKWLLALKAYDPDPPDGAVDVLLGLPTWMSGHTAVRHELYIGTTPRLGREDLVFSGTSWPSANFTPPEWKPQTTYYWRVDEVEANRARVHEGHVWTFVTAPSTAHRPDPRDGSRFVDPNAVPAWRPGLHMVLHDVYFGTDRQAVLHGTDETFRGRLETTVFDPGPLAEETAYFWRVDEIAADGGVHPGPVWRFVTLGPGGGIKAEYFNNISRYGTPAVTRVDLSIDFAWGDGSPDPAVESDYFSARWSGDLEPVFSDTYTFTVRTNGFARLWIDDDELIERQFLAPAPVDDRGTLELTAGQIYPILLEYEVGAGPATIQLFWQSPAQPRQIVPPGTLQPPLRAREPFPADRAVDTPHDPALRWTPGWKAASHDVYFGDDAGQVAGATTADADVYLGRLPAHITTARPGLLQWGREYCWRVDEVNETEAKSPWRGNLWTFTTADFLPIDDFESYSDHDGNRLYEVWIDGWINGTGSTVGYMPADPRPMRVHRGAQSMPFDYNNAEPPYYSEAQRTWSTRQDWTIHGAHTLSLWFMGAPVSFRETPAGGIALSGSGGDLACTYDPYRFACRRLDGDGAITTRIDSLQNGQGWARAGVMIADTPDAGSQYALVVVTAAYGLLFANCPFDNTAGVRFLQDDQEIPHWVKLVRTGNRLTAQHSPDGVVWEDVADSDGVPVVITMDLPQEVYLGVCVTSHRWDVIATAEFSGIQLAGAVSESWQVVETGRDQPGNAPDDLYVALADAGGRLAVAVHPDPAAVNAPGWTRWSIPLGYFRDAGVDLTSIRSMHLGVGDRNHPKPNGAGTIYIDDIRVVTNP